MSTATESINVDTDGSVYRHADHTLPSGHEVEVFDYISPEGEADAPTYILRFYEEPMTRQELGQVLAQLVEFLASTA